MVVLLEFVMLVMQKVLYNKSITIASKGSPPLVVQLWP